MYEKEINLTDVSFIFLRKLASREYVLQGPKIVKIDLTGGWWAVPRYMAPIFRLLGHWPTDQKFQNDYCTQSNFNDPMERPLQEMKNTDDQARIVLCGKVTCHWTCP